MERKLNLPGWCPDTLEYYSSKHLPGNHTPSAIEVWREGSQRYLSAASGLYGRICTEWMSGIRPEGMKSFAMTLRLPENGEYMRLKKIKVFDTDFDIEPILFRSYLFFEKLIEKYLFFNSAFK